MRLHLGFLVNFKLLIHINLFIDLWSLLYFEIDRRFKWSLGNLLHYFCRFNLLIYLACYQLFNLFLLLNLLVYHFHLLRLKFFILFFEMLPCIFRLLTYYIFINMFTFY